MFLARILFFRLHESPRYLVHAGRHREALENLQSISRFNGSEISLELEDVCDRRPPASIPETNGFAISDERAPFLSPSTMQETSSHSASPTLFDASASTTTDASPRVIPVQYAGEEATKGYQATDESPNSLDSHSFTTPVEEIPPPFQYGDILSSNGGSKHVAMNAETKRRRLASPPQYPPDRRLRSQSPSIDVEEMEKRFEGKPVGWADRFRKVLSPEWFRTTILVWGVWLSISLGGYRGDVR